MLTKWTSHLTDPETKQAFENSIRNSVDVLDRLRDILTEEKDGLERAELNVKGFDVPNWDYRQAYYNGCAATYKAISDILNLDQQTRTTNERITIKRPS